MAWTRMKLPLLFGLALSLSTACGDDDDGDDTGSDDGGVRDGGADAGGGIDAGRDGGNGAGGNIDAGRNDGGPGVDSGTSPLTSFFVTSDRSTTANLGGLAAADKRCQDLAVKVGLGSKSWRAYLSVARDPSNGNNPTEARSRIGTGPWRNAKGEVLANDLTSLHARSGNADVFLNEYGQKINGQWPGSPTPNEHDILTGTLPDGGVALGFTCEDWTSASDAGTARVGHSDGLGPGADGGVPYNSWFSSHTNRGCNDTAPAGGAGKLYCFAIN